jgi:hypothetical protein
VPYQEALVASISRRLPPFPVTALCDDTDPCADSFVLDEVGVVYLMGAVRPAPR